MKVVWILNRAKLQPLKQENIMTNINHKLGFLVILRILIFPFI